MLLYVLQFYLLQCATPPTCSTISMSVYCYIRVLILHIYYRSSQPHLLYYTCVLILLYNMSSVLILLCLLQSLLRRAPTAPSASPAIHVSSVLILLSFTTVRHSLTFPYCYICVLSPQSSYYYVSSVLILLRVQQSATASPSLTAIYVSSVLILLRTTERHNLTFRIIPHPGYVLEEEGEEHATKNAPQTSRHWNEVRPTKKKNCEHLCRPTPRLFKRMCFVCPPPRA